MAETKREEVSHLLTSVLHVLHRYRACVQHSCDSKRILYRASALEEGGVAYAPNTSLAYRTYTVHQERPVVRSWYIRIRSFGGVFLKATIPAGPCVTHVRVEETV